MTTASYGQPPPGLFYEIMVFSSNSRTSHLVTRCMASLATVLFYSAATTWNSVRHPPSCVSTGMVLICYIATVFGEVLNQEICHHIEDGSDKHSPIVASKIYCPVPAIMLRRQQISLPLIERRQFIMPPWFPRRKVYYHRLPLSSSPFHIVA